MVINQPLPPHIHNTHSYVEQEVRFENKQAGITLAGTLSLPQEVDKPCPAVILIAGMGPKDRDATFGNHKLFLVVADYLARRGIAVLRFDKRGVGASTGTFSPEVTSRDLAGDVLAAVNYLTTQPEINKSKIGLVGHSEGGMIAPMVAVQSSDIAFFVLMAGVVSTKIDDLCEQLALQLKADGASNNIIEKNRTLRHQVLAIIFHEEDKAKAEKQLKILVNNYLATLSDEEKTESEKYLFAVNGKNASTSIEFLNSSSFRFFLSHVPAATLEHVKIPLLALNGGLDFIVASEVALPIIEDALKKAGNKDYTIKLLPEMNHQFQTAKTGSLVEYQQIAETIAPEALKIMARWILERTGN